MTFYEHTLCGMPHRTTRQTPKRPLGRHFIKEWREHKGLTQDRLAERISEITGKSFSGASISRIETCKQPYNQGLLEAIAEALGTEAANLLMRNPSQPEAIWSIWDQAKPAQRTQIVEVAKALIRSAG